MKKLTRKEWEAMTDAEYAEARAALAPAAAQYADNLAGKGTDGWDIVFLGRIDEMARGRGLVR